MRQKKLWTLGLSFLLAGSIGQLVPRVDGTTPVDGGQAEQVVGGQYCSYYLTSNACGGTAKYNARSGTVLTYCPVEQDASYAPFTGVSGTSGPNTVCVECGVSCGMYNPLLVCGS